MDIDYRGFEYLGVITGSDIRDGFDLPVFSMDSK